MKQIASLNALRFFMVIIIVLRHAGLFWNQNYPFRSGYLAVDIFFILSGFLLAKTYKQLTYASGNNDVLLSKSYFLHRFSRLWPEYFLLCSWLYY